MNRNELLQLISAGGISLVWIVACGILITLHASLSITQHAGLQRLLEKFPDKSASVSRNQPRWDRLRQGVFLAAAICLIIGVSQGFNQLDALTHGHLAAFLLVLAAVAICLSILLEILPSVLAEGYADLISLRGLPLAVLVTTLLSPLARPLAWLEQKLMAWALSESDEDSRPSHEDEILSLVEDASDDELEEDERELIKSVFDFGETLVRESMTPRVEIDGLEASLTITACCEAINDSSHSRFPVYRETIDKIIGIVHVKDLLRLINMGQGGTSVGDSAKPFLSVAQTVPIDDLLDLLRSENEQVAVVVDEYGGTAGLITIEDIIEELVGDIHDEYDDEPVGVEHQPDGSIVLDARIDVDEANEHLNNCIPENEAYDSLGGFIYHRLGRIPKPGEVITVNGYSIKVRSASARRIETVSISRSPIPEDA